MQRFILILFLLVSAFASGKNTDINKMNLKPLSPLSIQGEQGLSGHFAGVVEDKIIVAGGCNFPNVPAADGGEKVFYDVVYLLDDPLSSNESWRAIGKLPKPMAYGVSISIPQGLICLGGSDGKSSLNDVYLIRLQDQELQITPLPSLPLALDNMAGCLSENTIYIAGGQCNGSGSNRVFKSSVKALLKGESWKELPSFSGEPRLQPCLAVQSNAGNPNLYLMGGYAVSGKGQEGVVHHNGLRLDLKTEKWSETASIPPDTRNSSGALVGSVCSVAGGGHLLFFGGVNAQIFEAAINGRLEDSHHDYMSHPVEWYRFNERVLVYHTLTDTWFENGTFPQLAKAGAALVPYQNGWVIIGGESKPGIRSTEVSLVSLDNKTSFGALNWLVLVAYLTGMLLLGYYFMRKEKGGEDFFKGGGRIPWWAAGISIYATMLSAITYMAYPAKAYATNWTYYPMLITILLVSFPVIRYYLPFFKRLNVTTAYEYLEHRFSGVVRLMASAVFIIFMVARMALVLYLPSLALTAVTGINIWVCIAMMGIITIIYCTMGGVEAVIWGDVVQGIILVGGALVSAVYLISSTEGGFSGFVDIAMADEKLKLVDWSLDFTKATFWVVLLGGIANNLISYTSDQTVIQRYLTTKNEKSASRSILLNGVMSAVVSIAFFAIGAGLYTFFKTHPAELDISMAKTDAIFPFFMMSQLPAGVAGLLIAAIFAATMSTISSNINSISTAFSVDFYKRWHVHATDSEMLRVARWACVVSGIIGVSLALLMATWSIYSLLDFFQEILGLLSSGLGGLFLMGIFFPRIDAKSALTGFVCGIAAVFCVKYLTHLNLLLYGCIGMVVSVTVGYLTSLVSPNRKNLNGLTWKELH